MATPEQNKEYYAKNKEKIRERRKSSTSVHASAFYVYAIILFASLTVTISRSAVYHSGEDVPWPVLSAILLEVSFIAVFLHRGFFTKLLGSCLGLYIASTLVIPSYNQFQNEFSLNSEISELKKEISDLKDYQATQKKYSYSYNLARNDIKRKETKLGALNQSDSEQIQIASPRSYLNSVSRIIFYLLMLFNSVFFSHRVAQSIGDSQNIKSQSRVIVWLQKLKIKWQAAKQAWIQI